MRVRATPLLVPERQAVVVATVTIYTQVVGPVVTLLLNNVKRDTDVPAVDARNVERVRMRQLGQALVATVVRTNTQEQELAAVQAVLLGATQ